jgi:hypothetical protein
LVEFDLLRPAGAIRVAEKIRDQMVDVGKASPHAEPLRIMY